MRQRNFPQTFRGENPFDGIENQTRRHPDQYPFTDCNTPTYERNSEGGGGGHGFNPCNNGGDAHVVFYRLPDSILFHQTDYGLRLCSFFSCYYLI